MAETEQRLIKGGYAHITGVHEKGPQGKNLKGKLDEFLRTSFPCDVWIPTDFTPKDQHNVNFGPMPESEQEKPADEQKNPEFEGVPTFNGDPSTQACRLAWDFVGENPPDLVHEYANHGCSGRIKAVQCHGTLTNLRYLFAGGEVRFSPDTIRIGLD